MLHVTIGEVIGMAHETGDRRHGRRVFWHHPRRVVIAPEYDFHFGQRATIHRMRPEVIERAECDDWCRFVWPSYCGIWKLFIDANGVCHEVSAGTPHYPGCDHCDSCLKNADDPVALARLQQRRTEARARYLQSVRGS
jgi:hypothetical protein